MSASDRSPADKGVAWRDGSEEASRVRDDVTEGTSRRAELYGLALDDRRDWRGRAARGSIWVVAGVVSLLANAEVLMWLAHRDFVDTHAGPADPAVVMIDLPAPERTPTMPAHLDATADTPDAATTQTAPDALAAETSQDALPTGTATRESDAPMPPEEIAPARESPPRKPPALLPVPRPQGHRHGAVARRVVEPPSSKRAATATRSAHADAGRRASQAASAFAGVSSAADWKSQVVAALNRAKCYPDGSDAVGSPTIRMTVAASGEVARVAIVASSGSSILDSAAIETVRRTSPLPPPPDGGTDLTFRMNFHLRSQ